MRALLFAAFFVIMGCGSGTSTSGVASSEQPHTPEFGQVALYAMPAALGNGNCSSWANACTFRTAVSRCSSTKQTVIYMGAGEHDTDNGSDANGTDINCDYVRLQGMGAIDEIGQPTQIVNNDPSASGADYLLRITGKRVVLANLAFDNSAKTDIDVTHINIRAGWTTVRDCIFRNSGSEASGTAIKIDNGANTPSLQNLRFRKIKTYAIHVDDATRVFAKDILIYNGGTGIYINHANASVSFWNNIQIAGMTTGINCVNAASTDHNFDDVAFMNNTTNVTTTCAYGGTFWSNVTSVRGDIPQLYPTGAGTSVSKDADAWAYGSAVTIIPASTIAKPFYITGINIQSWSAAQTYNFEILYGASTANTSLGFYSVRLGDTSAARAASIGTRTRAFVPANSIVGVKIATSGAGSQNVTISLSYETI